jgi:RHS repeat-associated protein
MNSSPPSLLCRYRYDPLDRLTSHVQSDTPQRHRFYCKSRLATEIQGTIGYAIVQHDNLLLAQQQFESGSPGTTLLATDLQRSVLHTLKKNAGRQPIAYSPYGHRSAENGLTSLLGFNGERPEPETGHYLLGNGYRAFNTFLRRFNSPDSLSPFEKGGLNTYAFCLGDPINQYDPTGNFALPNALASLFERALKAVGRTRRSTTFSVNTTTTTFKSGPSRVITPITSRATHNQFPDGDWYMNVEHIEPSGKTTTVNKIVSEHGRIFGHNNFEHYSFSATHNPQALAYSKLKGSEIQKLRNTGAISAMPDEDFSNAFTAFRNAEQTFLKGGYNQRTAFYMARAETRIKIREGKMRGVNPNANIRF